MVLTLESFAFFNTATARFLPWRCQRRWHLYYPVILFPLFTNRKGDKVGISACRKLTASAFSLPFDCRCKTPLTSCRWPAIIGIVVGIIVFVLAAYCCFRCCCRGRRRGGRNRANTTSMFNSAYQGYQPANNPNNAPPPYNETPRFAQFDVGGRGKSVGEDSLPAMPRWDAAQNKHVQDDVEMGRLESPEKPMLDQVAPKNSSAQPAIPIPAYAEVDSHPYNGPHEVHGASNQPPSGYTGPDFGHPYTGPEFGSGIGHGQHTSYSGYTSSEGTMYEPRGANRPHELGTTYSNTLPPPSPSAPQESFSPNAPSFLQAGRRPAAHMTDSWRNV